MAPFFMVILMRYFLILPLIVVSLQPVVASADWQTGSVTGKACVSTGSAAESQAVAYDSYITWLTNAGHVGKITSSDTYKNGVGSGCPWVSGGSYWDTRIYYLHKPISLVDPSDLNDPLDSFIYSDEQCESRYSGEKFLPGLTIEGLSALGSTPISVGGGVCSAVINSSVAACTSDGCWVGVEASSTNEIADFSQGVDTSSDPNDDPVPSYLTPVEECTSGSCITINGQVYEVYQDAIDQGTVSIIGGSTGGGDDGDGDTGGGDTGGGDGGDGGDGDGTGGSGGDGSGGGSGGSGGGSGDGSGDGDGSGTDPWSPGEVAIKSFDPNNEGEQLIEDAKQRLQDTFDEIRSEIASFNFTVSGSGGGCSSYVVRNATLDPCQKIDQFGSAARGAVMFLAALLSVGIILRGRD